MGDETHMVTASKVPMLVTGEFPMWKVRMMQYIRMVDYNIWEVIMSGNTLPKDGPDGKPLPIKSNEDKAQRKLEIKALGMLSMGIPNEYQLTLLTLKMLKH